MLSITYRSILALESTMCRPHSTIRTLFQFFCVSLNVTVPLTLPDFVHDFVAAAVAQDKLADSMIQVSMRLTLVAIEEVNAVDSLLRMSVIVDMFWDDEYAFWNQTLTPGAEVVHIPPTWLWKPDIQLYDAAEPFDENLVDTEVMLTPHVDDYLSTLQQSRPGTISSVCVMNLDRFPFDTQKCVLTFGSFMYQLETGGLNLSLAVVDPETAPGFLMLPSFRSLSWQVTDISTSTGIEHEYGSIAAVYYTLTLERDSTFYYSTAIIPNLAISIVAMLAMWIADLSSRLGVAITAMLSVVAIMVSDVT
jgi:nicotinic acetylcholine receptor, invertebrate